MWWKSRVVRINYRSGIPPLLPRPFFLISLFYYLSSLLSLTSPSAFLSPIPLPLSIIPLLLYSSIFSLPLLFLYFFLLFPLSCSLSPLSWASFFFATILPHRCLPLYFPISQPPPLCAHLPISFLFSHYPTLSCISSSSAFLPICLVCLALAFLSLFLCFTSLSSLSFHISLEVFRVFLSYSLSI